MFKFQKEKCTQETEGKVIKKRWNGDVWFLTVDKLTEQLKYQVIKTHKLGKIPVGMSSKVSLGNVNEGDHVRIKYNPLKPKKAYMPENSGMQSICSAKTGTDSSEIFMKWLDEVLQSIWKR